MPKKVPQIDDEDDDKIEPLDELTVLISQNSCLFHFLTEPRILGRKQEDSLVPSEEPNFSLLIDEFKNKLQTAAREKVEYYKNIIELLELLKNPRNFEIASHFLNDDFRVQIKIGEDQEDQQLAERFISVFNKLDYFNVKELQKAALRLNTERLCSAFSETPKITIENWLYNFYPKKQQVTFYKHKQETYEIAAKIKELQLLLSNGEIDQVGFKDCVEFIIHTIWNVGRLDATSIIQQKVAITKYQKLLQDLVAAKELDATGLNRCLSFVKNIINLTTLDKGIDEKTIHLIEERITLEKAKYKGTIHTQLDATTYFWAPIQKNASPVEPRKATSDSSIDASPGKTLTLITFAPKRTFGDASAAFKFLQEFMPQAGKIEVNWIIALDNLDSDPIFYNYFIESAKKLGVNVILANAARIKDGKFEPDKRDVKEKILSVKDQTDLFFAFPTKIYLSEVEGIDELSIMGEIPLLGINEFNHPVVGETDYATGIGDGYIGIQVSPLIDRTKDINVSDMPAKDISFFKTLLGDGFTNANSDGLISVTGLNAYQKNSFLYFGYFNGSEARHKHDTPNFFVNTCLELSHMKQPLKNVDIVVRFNPAAEAEFRAGLDMDMLKQQYSNVVLIDKEGNMVPIATGSNSNLPAVRLFNPFPLSGDSFQKCMAISSSFVAATGDGSQAEAISQNKYGIYECMSWKSRFYDAFRRLCYNINRDSSRNKLSELHSIDFFRRSSRNISYKEYAKFLYDNEGALLRDTKRLRNAVEKYHNVNGKMVRIVLDMLGPSKLDLSSKHIAKKMS